MSQPPVDLSRRRALLSSSARVGLLLGAGGLAACQASGMSDRALKFASLAEAEVELQRLAAARERISQTALNWSQTLVHCAQSIELSMSGFPVPKSALFQRTVGAAAITVFSWRGRMSHDLAEPIPGAQPLDAALAPERALARLQAAVRAFGQWGGPLQPHFAYGALDKPRYEQAHAMHLANHLSAFEGRA
jgi:Protein of unknown function (DUF1569)